jgi:hypothetical protein
VNDQPSVVAVSLDSKHRFSKANAEEVVLIADVGVQGDAHAGARCSTARGSPGTPPRPNLRQVHLMHAELFDELRGMGYDVAPGSWART